MKRSCALVIGMLFTTHAFADQAAWVTRAEAEEVAKHIKVDAEIRHFCAPCNDTGFKREVVKTVKVEALKDNYFQVAVNGNGIDAAYVYVLENAKWQDVAILANVKVSDVPSELPAELKETVGEPVKK